MCCSLSIRKTGDGKEELVGVSKTGENEGRCESGSGPDKLVKR